MNKYLVVIFLFIGIFSGNAQGLEAYFSYGIFNIPDDKPYIETYLTITNRSVKWKKLDTALTSSIEVTLVLWKDTTIESFSKEVIKNSLREDSVFKKKNLIYIQRLQANNGRYRIQIKLDDLNDSIKPFETGTFIDINFPKDSTRLSSIMAVNKIEKTTTPNKSTKSGYDLIPNVFNFFPTSENKFTFYTEIYPGTTIKKGDPFLVVYYLKNHESDQILPQFKRFKRMTASLVNILLNSFDISSLYSGNFDFVVEVRDISNNLVAEQYYFLQRENLTKKMNVADISSINIGNSFAELITNRDTLQLILQSMNPISSEMEKEFVKTILLKDSIYVLQQYLLSFWENRDINYPEVPFKKYMEQVNIVEKMYSSRINHGFETDRGRVYLQYGRPNTVVKNYNEPSAYPYEIWHYYNLKNQSNRKFIFYNTDLSSNEFALLHSDAIGEVNDYQWRLRLRSRDSGYQSIDQTGEGETDWGSRYNEWYQEPR